MILLLIRIYCILSSEITKNVRCKQELIDQISGEGINGTSMSCNESKTNNLKQLLLTKIPQNLLVIPKISLKRKRMKGNFKKKVTTTILYGKKTLTRAQMYLAE